MFEIASALKPEDLSHSQKETRSFSRGRKGKDERKTSFGTYQGHNMLLVVNNCARACYRLRTGYTGR